MFERYCIIFLIIVFDFDILYFFELVIGLLKIFFMLLLGLCLWIILSLVKFKESFISLFIVVVEIIFILIRGFNNDL